MQVRIKKLTTIVLSIGLVFTITQAYALQQTAGPIEFSLQPGETQTLQWGLVSDKEIPTTLEIFAKGQGSELLSFQKSLLPEPQKITWVDIKVTIPKNYSNNIELNPIIYALEKGDNSKDNSGVVINIQMQKELSIKIGNVVEKNESVKNSEINQTVSSGIAQTLEKTQSMEKNSEKSTKPSTYSEKETSQTNYDTTPMQSVLKGDEKAGSGSPLVSWDATGTVIIGIVLAGVVGSITAVVFLKSKKLEKY